MHRVLPAVLAGVAIGIAGCGGSSPTTNSNTAKTAAATPPASGPFLAGLHTIDRIASTVPASGDVNPYGLVEVTSSVGRLRAGSLLVSNFNDRANEQGTGTTIVQVAPSGSSSLFATVAARSLPGPCPGGVGLTTALDVLPGGYVVVGSLPTSNGKSATARAGCLIVLNSDGRPVRTIASANIAGPWDMTAVSHGSATTLFVSNALNGGAARGVHTIDNSTVLRLQLTSGPGRVPTVTGEQVIATGIPWRDDPAALVIGPTGVALAPNGTLYLADTLANRILAIPQAMTRTTPAPGGGRTVAQGGHSSSRSGCWWRRTGTSSPPTRATATWSRRPRPAGRWRCGPPTARPAKARCSGSPWRRKAAVCTSSTTGKTP